MPLYMIRRDLGNATQDDVDAASLRAISCAYNYDGLRWLTSYWNPESGIIMCTYEADNEQQIRDHSAQARLPVDEIIRVFRVDPSAYADQVSVAITPQSSTETSARIAAGKGTR